MSQTKESEWITADEASYKRKYFQHSTNIFAFIKAYGVENIAFVTLTFLKKIYSRKEAEKKLNSLLSRALRKRYGKDSILIVRERHLDNGIHYHMLIKLPFKIGTPANITAVKENRHYKASRILREEWEWFVKTLKKYGFGRNEFHPILTNIDGISCYLCKYLAKEIRLKCSDDKGGQLVRVPKKTKVVSSKFSWHSENAMKWRSKLKKFAIGLRFFGLKIYNISDFKRYFGSKWCHKLRGIIAEMPEEGSYANGLHIFQLARCTLNLLEKRWEEFELKKDWRDHELKEGLNPHISHSSCYEVESCHI